ncbi:hypothetical protein D8L93_04070, partial [Sodalis-like symbiont of Bactericera trigonica]
MTFTIPCQYWELVAENRWLLSAFSKLAAEVILEYCAKRGIQPGIFNAIHTWGRDMKWHPHIHLSTTAGRLTADGKRWKSLEFHHRTRMKQISQKTKRLERLKMSLDTFIEKFIQHIPDKHFRMIRYYGFLSHAK